MKMLKMELVHWKKSWRLCEKGDVERHSWLRHAEAGNEELAMCRAPISTVALEHLSAENGVCDWSRSGNSGKYVGAGNLQYLEQACLHQIPQTLQVGGCSSLLWLKEETERIMPTRHVRRFGKHSHQLRHVPQREDISRLVFV